MLSCVIGSWESAGLVNSASVADDGMAAATTPSSSEEMKVGKALLSPSTPSSSEDTVVGAALASTSALCSSEDMLIVSHCSGVFF